MATTIQIEKNLKQELDAIKIHPRETYNELISRLLNSGSLENASRESLIATIEVLSDPETMRDIAQALEEYEEGGGTSLEDLKKELNINV